MLQIQSTWLPNRALGQTTLVADAVGVQRSQMQYLQCVCVYMSKMPEFGRVSILLQIFRLSIISQSMRT